MSMKNLALLSIFVSTLASANEMTITANKIIISNDTKVKTYVGDVKISFDSSKNLTAKSNVVRFKNSSTVMEGDVEIIFSHTKAKTDKVTFFPTSTGLTLRMEQVTLTNH
ncbi:MAG: hypothetical protein JKY19_00425 [Alcanivoracaceae bacterium]|nr:hypothetical protein [Alcanivoracaceae bacterium]